MMNSYLVARKNTGHLYRLWVIRAHSSSQRLHRTVILFSALVIGLLMFECLYCGLAIYHEFVPIDVALRSLNPSLPFSAQGTLVFHLIALPLLLIWVSSHPHYFLGQWQVPHEEQATEIKKALQAYSVLQEKKRLTRSLYRSFSFSLRRALILKPKHKGSCTQRRL